MAERLAIVVMRSALHGANDGGGCHKTYLSCHGVEVQQSELCKTVNCVQQEQECRVTARQLQGLYLFRPE